MGDTGRALVWGTQVSGRVVVWGTQVGHCCGGTGRALV